MSDIAERAADVTGPAGGQPPAGNGFLRALRHGSGAFLRQREATVFVVVVALFIYFLVVSPNFFTHANMANLLSGIAAPYIILAIGEVYLLICGEIDLSVGFVVTLAPFLMYYLIEFYGVPSYAAIMLALLFGLVVGWINGFLTVTLRLPSFIATLGTSFVLYGVVLTTPHASPVNVPVSVEHIGKFFGNKTERLGIVPRLSGRSCSWRSSRWCSPGPVGACTRSRWAGTSSARGKTASAWPGSSTGTS